MQDYSSLAPFGSGRDQDEDYRDIKTVITHLVRDMSLFEAARPMLEEMAYFQNFPFANAIYGYMKSYYDQYGGKLPNLSAYANDIPAWFEYYQLQEVEVADYTRLLRSAFMAHRAEIDNEHAIGLIMNDYSYFITAGFRASVSPEQEVEIETVYSRAKEFVQKWENDPFTKAKVEAIFDQDFDQMLEATIRKSLGVKFMDEMLDGGVAPGELIGVLAPSGGGKSTIGCMIMAACVATERKCWYYSTEQKLQGDLFMRFCCLASGQPRKVFGMGWANVPDDIKQDLERCKPKYKKYSRFVDVSESRYQSLEALFEDVQKEIEEGNHPGCIVVDWWGRLSDQINISNDMIKTDNQARRNNRDNLHKMKQFAEKFKCPIIILHQLSGDANAKSPKAKLKAANAQEDKTFNNMFDFCFVIGNRDGDDVANVTTDKARSVARTTRRQKLNGAYCRFEDPDDYDMDAASYDAELSLSTLGGQTKTDLQPGM